VAFPYGAPAARLIAERIAAKLRRPTVEAHAMPIDEVDKIDGYDAVVVGSPMFSGTWSTGAQDFIDRNRRTLGCVPLWLYSCGSPTAPRAPTGPELAEFNAAIDPVIHWLLPDRDFTGLLTTTFPSWAIEEIPARAVA